MEKGVLFSRFRPDSKIKIMAEPEMIDFLQKKEYHVLQIVDLLGSRPINVLRYLVEYREDFIFIPKENRRVENDN